jgi:hypothetical protein
MTIIATRGKLKEYGRKIGGADQAAKTAYQDMARVLIVTRCLPVD